MTATATKDTTGTVQDAPMGVVAFAVALERFRPALAAVMGAVLSRLTLPVLGHVLMRTDSAGVWLTATDLDVTVTAFVPADIETGGAFLLPAKRLSAIVAELPPVPIRFRAAGEQIHVECGRAKFKLATLPIDEFPTTPTVDYQSGTIIAGDLTTLVKRTAFAASDAESRPIMGGVSWRRSAGTVRLVATDGHRLALNEQPMEGSVEIPEIIVPRKALEYVARLFGASDEVEIGIADGFLGLRSATASMRTRLIEGPYLTYEQVIPREWSRTVVADRLAFISAVRRCMAVASERTHLIKITIGHGMVRVAAQTPDTGEASDEFAATLTGADLTLGIDATLLLPILSAIPTDEIRIHADSPERAVTIEPIAANDADTLGRSLYLLMPMRLLD